MHAVSRRNSRVELKTMTTQNKSGDKTRSELQQKKTVSPRQHGYITELRHRHSKRTFKWHVRCRGSDSSSVQEEEKRTEVEDYNTMTRLQPRSHHVLSDHLADIEMTDQLQLTSTNVRCHPLDASHKLQITRDQTVSPLVSFINH